MFIIIVKCVENGGGLKVFNCWRGKDIYG